MPSRDHESLSQAVPLSKQNTFFCAIQTNIDILVFDSKNFSKSMSNRTILSYTIVEVWLHIVHAVIFKKRPTCPWTGHPFVSTPDGHTLIWNRKIRLFIIISEIKHKLSTCFVRIDRWYLKINSISKLLLTEEKSLQNNKVYLIQKSKWPTPNNNLFGFPVDNRLPCD